MLNPLTQTENLRIIDKNSQVIPLKLNSIQKQFVGGMSHRDIILKSRQVGISTIILARFYLEAILTPNLTCVVVSHEEEATRKLFEKVKTFHKYFTRLCGEEGIPCPELFHNSANEMSFPELGSTFYIGTAGKRAFGRGATLNRVHCSELAFWPEDKAETILAGIEEATPLDGYIALESTPNGIGGLFYRKVMDALREEGVYKLHFYPWWLHTEYALDSESEFVFPTDKGVLRLKPTELALMDLYGLTQDQIRWRRRKQRERAHLYPQEYPEDKVTCFLGSQYSVFPTDILRTYLQQSKPPMVLEDEGLLKIWQLPRPMNNYVIGADTSTGDAFSYSAATVVNAKTAEHVATLRGKFNPDLFADKLAGLGNRYNGALVAVERNFTGHSVLNSLVNRIGYNNLYRMRKKTLIEKEVRIGWDTNKLSKPMMIAELKSLLDSYAFTTFDEVLLTELSNYVYIDGTQKTGAKEGTDDLACAAMISVAARQDTPTLYEVRKRPVSEQYAP